MADYSIEVSIPSVAPATTVSSADIEVTNATKGLVLKSANGTRWRITVDDAGIPTITALAALTP